MPDLPLLQFVISFSRLCSQSILDFFPFTIYYCVNSLHGVIWRQRVPFCFQLECCKSGATVLKSVK